MPLGGPGGKLAIFELSKPGKLPDGVTPTLVNANTIMDFSWDPFNNRRVAVGCDDGVTSYFNTTYYNPQSFTLTESPILGIKTT